MASVTCPLLGTWSGSGSITSLTFNDDGTVDVNGTENQYSFLVWETDTDHKLVTLDGSANTAVYDFTISGSALQLTLSVGSGSLGGNYTAGTVTPGPMDLSNPLLTGWTAVVTGDDPGTGNWELYYSADGVVALTHSGMHSFTCAYLVRMVGDTYYLVTYGQMRFAPPMAALPVRAKFAAPSGSPLTTTVFENQQWGNTWDYTKMP